MRTLDFRLALRMLLRRKVLTLSALSILALGIGGNTAIFSGIHAYLGTPLPYREPQSLVWIAEARQPGARQQSTLSWANAQDLARAQAIAAVGFYRTDLMRFGRGNAQYVTAVTATPELLTLLGAKPVAGRIFSAGDQRTAVVSNAFWRTQFGSNSDIAGRTILLDGRQYSVAAILPASFSFLYEDVDVFVPLDVAGASRTSRGDRQLSAIGRLRRGATVAEADAQVRAIGTRLVRLYPEDNAGWTPEIMSLEDYVIPRDSRVAATILLVAVGLVLVVACANVAALLLSHGVSRRRELGIRLALGAARSDLVRLLLWDGALLALAGAAAGIAIAYVGVPVLKSMVPPGTPRLEAMQLNQTALLYTAFMSMMAAVLGGVIPAWSLSGSKPEAELHSGGRSTTAGPQRLLQVMAMAQIATAVVLLGATSLLIRTLHYQLTFSPGFDQHNLLVASITLPPDQYASAPRAAARIRSIIAGTAALPGVRSVAASDRLPLGGSPPVASVDIEGRAVSDKGERAAAARGVVSPGWFHTLGVSLISGRDLDARDAPGRPLAAMVNQTMARRYWGSAANAVGRRFRNGDGWITVVGVVSDTRPENIPSWTVVPQFYVSGEQAPATSAIIIARTNTDPNQLGPRFTSVVWNLDRNIAINRAEALDDLLIRHMASIAALAKILGFLSGTALFLAMAGVYGMLATMTAWRVREFGVRMALGASRGDTFRFVLGRGWKLVATAVGFGLPLAWAVLPVLRILLVGVQPHDTITLAGVPFLLFACATLACVVPAWRAAAIDPAESLRAD